MEAQDNIGDAQPNIGDAIYKFVGQKIAKVRWCPSRSQLEPTEEFVTGSWDDEVNSIALWNVPNLQTQTVDIIDGDLTNEPELILKSPHKGNVTDIKFIDSRYFLSGSSCGDVNLYKLGDDRQLFDSVKSWESVHRFSDGEKCACTALAFNDANIASVGEDGSICVLQQELDEPHLQFDGADGSTFTGVSFIRASEIVTINSIGQMKVWDLRQQSRSPTRVLCLSGEKAPLLSIDRHPNQAHVLVTGYVNGNIGFWDLRQETFPVTLVEAHGSSVWEVKFHKLHPDNLFTCSEDGSLWYWDGSTIGNRVPDYRSPSSRPKGALSGSTAPDLKSMSSNSVWLSFNVHKHKMETYSLIPSNKRPINSFDIESKTLISSTDSEALVLLTNIPIR